MLFFFSILKFSTLSQDTRSAAKRLAVHIFIAIVFITILTQHSIKKPFQEERCTVNTSYVVAGIYKKYQHGKTWWQ